MPKRLPTGTGYILLSGYDGYSIRLGPSGKYRIGLNIVRTGRIGVKGLVIEYGEYPVECNEYLPTPSLKPLSRFANQFEILLLSRIWEVWFRCCSSSVGYDAMTVILGLVACRGWYTVVWCFEYRFDLFVEENIWHCHGLGDIFGIVCDISSRIVPHDDIFLYWLKAPLSQSPVRFISSEELVGGFCGPTTTECQEYYIFCWKESVSKYLIRRRAGFFAVGDTFVDHSMKFVRMWEISSDCHDR